MISINIKEESAVDDMFQNLFLSVVQTPVPPDTDKIVSYIYKILTNDLIDETRKSEVYKRFVGLYRRESYYNTKNKNPEKEVIDFEEVQRMFEALRKLLPTHLAEAVIQSCILGYNNKDAARNMDLDTTTFSQYLHRGKARIRKLAEEKSSR